MRTVLLLAVICLISFACGGKKEDQAMTPEQETKLVDSVATELDAQVQDLNKKADSVSAEVDSLLQGI